MFSTFSKPSRFNYSNLHEEDKKIADRMIKMIYTINTSKLFYLESSQNSAEKNLANKLKLEGIEIATNRAIENTIGFIRNTIIDYDEDVPEIDTEDHFYGAEYPEQLFYGLAILDDPRFTIKISSVCLDKHDD